MRFDFDEELDELLRKFERMKRCNNCKYGRLEPWDNARCCDKDWTKCLLKENTFALWELKESE